MLGLADAESAENNVPSANMVITPVMCEIPRGAPGELNPPRTEPVRILPGSRAARAYATAEAQEALVCNFELNPTYRVRMEASGLVVSGVGPRGEARIAEWPGPAFQVGMMSVPSYLSRPGSPHSLITAFVRAAAEQAHQRPAGS